MADMKGTIKVELENDVRVLKYNYNALCDFDEVARVNLANMQAQSSLSPSDMRAFVWAGMQWNGDPTLEDAGDLIDEIIQQHGIEYLGEKIQEAMAAIFPQEEIEEIDDQDEADIKN